MTLLTSTLLLLPVCAPDWSIFEAPLDAAGSPTGPGRVLGVDDLGVLSVDPRLEGVELLDVEFVGRTRLERFLPTRPRREALAGGASRLVLPGGQGSLYRYRRTEPSGATYGLFLVRSDAAPRVLLERSATGPSVDLDPFLPKLAVDAAGTHLLVATTAAAGGELLEVDIQSGLVENRTPAGAPHPFRTDGLLLAPAFGLAISESGPLRFDRAAPGPAAPVPTPGGHSHFGPPAVLSDNGTVAAYLAGSSETSMRVFTVTASGPAEAAAMPEQRLEGGGFLPEAKSGPWLTLSSDGQQVAYRTLEFKADGQPTREVWIAPTTVGSPADQLTSDAAFIDTIDEVGILRFVVGGLLFGAGEAGDAGEVDKLDLYLADAQSGALANLTLSSGDPLAPFLAQASISADDGLFLSPSDGRILVHDGNHPSGGRLLMVDPSNATTVELAQGVKSVDETIWTGASFALSTRSETQPRRRELLRVDASPAATTLVSLPENAQLLGLASSEAGELGTVVELGASRWIARVDPLTASASLLTPTPLPWLDRLEWSGAALRATLAQTLLPGAHLGWATIGPIELAPTLGYSSVLLPAR